MRPGFAAEAQAVPEFQPEKGMPEISVIITTFNRPDSLLATLQSLKDQEYMDFEVVVVDNAAAAGTESVVRAFASQASFPVVYEGYPHGGNGGARNQGVRKSRAELVVFTDDDVSPVPGWLAAYQRRFAEHPEMSAAGGRIRPQWETPPPQWLLDYIGTGPYFGPYALMDQGPELLLGPKVMFFGCNMAFRRSVFALSGFHPELFGTRTIGDGESGFYEDLMRAGLLLGYVPEAEVRHRIGPGRMRAAYIRRWAWHLGGCLMFQEWRGRKRTLAALARAAVNIVRDYCGCWVSYALRAKDHSRECLDQGARAQEGLCRLAYVYWMWRGDPLIVSALDAKDFTICPCA